MKTIRRGLGTGRGKGWKNLMSDDAFRHKLAKFGIRSVQAPLMRRNRLPLQIAIIVPSTKRDKPIPAQEFRNRVRTEKVWFSSTFGGDTSVGLPMDAPKDKKGKKDEQSVMVGSYWDGKKIIREGNALVQSSTTVEKYNQHKKNFLNHLRKRKKDWKQQSIFVRIEGQDFIYPKQKLIDDDKEQEAIIPVQ